MDLQLDVGFVSRATVSFQYALVDRCSAGVKCRAMPSDDLATIVVHALAWERTLPRPETVEAPFKSASALH